MIQDPAKNKRHRQQILNKDSLVAFIIISLPLLYLFIHTYLSRDISSISIGNLNYNLPKNTNFGNLVFYLFISFIKITYISIWYITCKNKWYKAIITLLILQFYRLVTTFNYDIFFIEHNTHTFKRFYEIGLGVLFVLVLLPTLNYLRKHFNTYNVLKHIDEKLKNKKTTKLESIWTRKDWIFFYSIIFTVLCYFFVIQYISYFKYSSHIDITQISRYKITLFYILTDRITLIIYLLTWLLSCHYWWQHALIIPVSVYTIQIITLFQVAPNDIDNIELIYITPILFIVISVLYLLRRNTLEKIDVLSLLEYVEKKITDINTR